MIFFFRLSDLSDSNYEQIWKMFVEKGVDVNKENRMGRTAIETASAAGTLHIIIFHFALSENLQYLYRI